MPFFAGIFNSIESTPLQIKKIQGKSNYQMVNAIKNTSKNRMSFKIINKKLNRKSNWHSHKPIRCPTEQKEYHPVIIQNLFV